MGSGFYNKGIGNRERERERGGASGRGVGDFGGKDGGMPISVGASRAETGRAGLNWDPPAGQPFQRKYSLHS